MYNGTISQILDLNYLLKKELPKIYGALRAKLKKQTLPKEFRKDELSFFLGKNGMHYSIPSKFIEKTSKIKSKNIQPIDGKHYTSISGKTIPLIFSENLEALYQDKLDGKLHAIIFPLADRDVGLIVTNIVNTCEAAIRIDEVTYKRRGVFGSVLVGGNITQVLDLYGFAEIAFKNIVEFKNKPKFQSGITPTLLVVDDSDFFLNIIKDYVQYAGYRVYTAKDGVEGLDILNKYSKEIELVITDIEMPNMDGIDFTKKIRSTSDFQHLPIVAVSSLSDDRSVKRGIDAGVDVYLAKLDREKILKSVSQLLKAKD